MYPLISAVELADLLHSSAVERPALLDVRWRLGGPASIDSYRNGHLPGAVFVDVDTELAGPAGAGGRHPLPEPAQLQRVLRGAGVRAGYPVVVYDDADGSVAARAWWLLRWAGHDEVAVLDGGYAAWVAQGRAVTTEEGKPPTGDLVVTAGGMPVLDAEGAAELARRGTLLDARATARYTGASEPVDPRAGHIPGAVNAPATAHAGTDGVWRSAEELADHFRTLGVSADAAVGAYCGSGINASATVLALEVAGREGPAALYAGSWSQWSRDERLPAVTGNQPG